MRNNVDLDLSDQPDLDALCVQDYKFTPGTPVDFLEDRFGLTFWPAMVTVDLDEIVSIRFQNEQGQEQTQWILTQKCKLYPQGIISKTYKYIEMQRINSILLKKAQKEAEERAAVEQIERPVHHAQRGYSAINDDRDEEDDDEDDEDYDVGVQPQGV